VRNALFSVSLDGVVKIMSDKLQHPNLWLHDEYCLVCGFKSESVYKPELLKNPVTLTCYRCGSKHDIAIDRTGEQNILEMLEYALELDQTIERVGRLRKKLGYKF